MFAGEIRRRWVSHLNGSCRWHRRRDDTNMKPDREMVTADEPATTKASSLKVASRGSRHDCDALLADEGDEAPRLVQDDHEPIRILQPGLDRSDQLELAMPTRGHILAEPEFATPADMKSASAEAMLTNGFLCFGGKQTFAAPIGTKHATTAKARQFRLTPT